MDAGAKLMLTRFSIPRKKTTIFTYIYRIPQNERHLSFGIHITVTLHGIIIRIKYIIYHVIHTSSHH